MQSPDPEMPRIKDKNKTKKQLISKSEEKVKQTETMSLYPRHCVDSSECRIIEFGSLAMTMGIGCLTNYSLVTILFSS